MPLELVLLSLDSIELTSPAVHTSLFTHLHIESEIEFRPIAVVAPSHRAAQRPRALPCRCSDGRHRRRRRLSRAAARRRSTLRRRLARRRGHRPGIGVCAARSWRGTAARHRARVAHDREAARTPSSAAGTRSTAARRCGPGSPPPVNPLQVLDAVGEASSVDCGVRRLGHGAAGGRLLLPHGRRRRRRRRCNLAAPTPPRNGSG